MEKKILNPLFFKENIPPASERFEERTLAMLRHQMALDNTRRFRRRKWTTALAIGVVCVVLIATALAVGLQWSARYNVLRIARQAVMEKYGLTQETLSVFSESAGEERGKWTVQYMPTLFDGSAMGRYTVVIVNGTAVEVGWSHDDVPQSEEDGGFNASAWGQA